jgi:cation diffusion facilitator CzcD-associated flavoprotein CzcO
METMPMYSKIGATFSLTVQVRVVPDRSPRTLEPQLIIRHIGLLNAWKWPAIPGLQSFKGPLLHTAAWDRSVNLDGKRIALIGVGSSGVQVLPALQPKAEVSVNH